MSYLVLARKYRPQDFSSISGQEQVTRTLSNAIKRDKVHHAHLFCGPRGVGKTSIARIFAKSLNCQTGPTSAPCLKCQNCLEITSGTSLAVREIDGASHNSVENVRDLIDSFRSLPPPGSRYKIYIIDEVHMLSVAAFNALLKSLEEPPPNTVFILATTEIHKIPETVISRCVRHDFRALSSEQIANRLKTVCDSEKLDIEPEVLRMVTRISDGSMRDAQSLLDRLQSFCEGKITADEAGQVLGTVSRAALLTLSKAVLTHDSSAALKVIEQVFSRGVDPAVFLREFVAYWRDLLIAKFAGASALVNLGLDSSSSNELEQLVKDINPNDIQDLVTIAREGADSALRSAYVKYGVEALVVRMSTREPVVEIAQVISLLKSYKGGEPVKGSPVPPTTSSDVRVGSSANVATSLAPSTKAEASRSTASQVQQKAAQPQAPTKPSTTVAEASASNVPSGAPLDWGKFITFASTNCPRVVFEHLKRVSVSMFQAGWIEASAPKFSAMSLQNQENLSKLKTALEAFSSIKNWKITFKATIDGEAPAGSVLHSELSKGAAAKKKKEQEMINHPALKSLQEVFPGSSIEGIKVQGDD